MKKKIGKIAVISIFVSLPDQEIQWRNRSVKSLVNQFWGNVNIFRFLFGCTRLSHDSARDYLQVST